MRGFIGSRRHFNYTSSLHRSVHWYNNIIISFAVFRRIIIERDEGENTNLEKKKKIACHYY